MEKTSFALQIDRGALARTAYGSIRGGIWCEVGGESFPCGRWRDRVAEVVCRWLAAVQSLLDGRRTEASLSFLDGPYEVCVHTGAEGVWSAQLCVHHYHGVEVRYAFTFDRDAFVGSLLAVADLLLAEGEHRGWMHGDMDSIRISVDRIRGIAA